MRLKNILLCFLHYKPLLRKGPPIIKPTHPGRFPPVSAQLSQKKLRDIQKSSKKKVRFPPVYVNFFEKPTNPTPHRTVLSRGLLHQLKPTFACSTVRGIDLFSGISKPLYPLPPPKPPKKFTHCAADDQLQQLIILFNKLTS